MLFPKIFLSVFDFGIQGVSWIFYFKKLTSWARRWLFPGTGVPQGSTWTLFESELPLSHPHPIIRRMQSVLLTFPMFFYIYARSHILISKTFPVQYLDVNLLVQIPRGVNLFAQTSGCPKRRKQEGIKSERTIGETPLLQGKRKLSVYWCTLFFGKKHFIRKKKIRNYLGLA